ncbi:MAG TPA: NAD-glutamate dehydrogenase [Solirubrobacteraceae bacterium]|nr:NAD-glutamate dehydrogenase [Solirubrobacteraceae bacterium]
MAVKGAELDSELIDTVCERVRERLPSEQATPCEAFTRQYYQWVPPEDLADRNPLDLYGAAVAHWNLAQQRAPGEAKVRVYNPDFEQHGWQSPHTVIEIVSDDMPFIVDSVTMELTRKGYGIHLVIHPVMRIRRDQAGHILEVLDPDAKSEDAIPESILHAEVGREHDLGKLDELRRSVERVLDQVRAAVEDWQQMRARTQALTEELEESPPAGIDSATVEETKAFLTWLADDNFTFLGYRDYELTEDGDGALLTAIEGSGLGILRGSSSKPPKRLSPKAAAFGREPKLLLLTKANSASPVHRPAYLDYIGVKRYDEEGRVIGERRFLGLYTTRAYKASPRSIPIIRGKVEGVLHHADFPPASHDRKALLEILESYPRDSLFQMETEDLFTVAIGILGLGERQRLRLFMWRDPLDRFVECLVCIPRDRFNTENRERVGRILLDALGGVALDWTLQLSESRLARVHYIIRCGEEPPGDYDVSLIEARCVQAVRAWGDDLREALLEDHGEEDGMRLFRRYERAFPAGYQADWVARSAVADIARIEELASTDEPITSLYRPLEAPEGMVRLKLFSSGGMLLSDVLPTLEHLGAKVADERPYEITAADRGSAWIYDFGLQADPEGTERVRDLLHDAFLGVWRGELEDDGLNGLVLKATLTGRQVSIIRAIGKYLRQGGISFSDAYIERTLTGHPDVARLLVELFNARLDPDRHDRDLAEKIATEIDEALDAVPSLDEDRILRSFLSIVRAIVRTNAFQLDAGGKPHPYLSFKLDSEQIPLLPLPRPQYEIFVYSPRVEAVHLRGGKVARGGIRWSDRREDFRTEVLGLMKAQMVKNALIVPVGAKGGFVLKRPPADGGREALVNEAIGCYKTFLSGMLDVTDNIVEGKVVAPQRVVRYDDDDPYLVVAADKGTATFSDIANEVSLSYGFWLGDAFASGGSQGYDHKQMGITARGAWESVKRHFRELGVDIQTTDFTAVGVGDMSGDVFGNGMLCSPHTRLIAAFNHVHVFLDPDPDPEKSYAERRRLFGLERSSWSDYDESLISEGGGVFSRSAKSIKLSPEIREALNIEAEKVAPNDLIQLILKAPVDLLFNGGIGTYVKASTESQADVGDKANDALRVDARELRCRVVGEGGNLGLTQRARIEYALVGGPDNKGGRINTDAIDNVAGVNTSDHEVNIKILLDGLVADGDMTEKQRNELLHEMTDAVGEQVLYGSYTQTQAISLALAQAPPMVDVHARLIRYLEQNAGLNRKLEFLPSDDTIEERKAAHQGLVAPELAVVMAYIKIHLYRQLLDSDLPEDGYLAHDLERYFPPPLPERYSEQMRGHRLKREIIATVVANQLVDRAGTTFAFRLLEETGTLPAVLARAYATAREVLDMRSYWEEVQALDNQVAAQTQLGMLIESRRLVERATRWLVRANPYQVSVAQTIRRFRPGAELLAAALPGALEGADREAFDARAAELEAAGVPADLARRAAGMPSMLALFDIVEVATATERDPADVLEVYFRVGSRLELNWLRDRIIDLPRANRWQALARASLRDDLFNLYRELTRKVLDAGAQSGPVGEQIPGEAAIEAWSERNAETLERALGMVAEIRASRIYDNTTLPVALREIRALLRGTSRVGGPVGSVTMGE